MSLVCLGALPFLATAACSEGGGGAQKPTDLPGIATPAALSTEAPAKLYGADAGDHAAAVTSGDFNADGSPDIALAAAFADGPENARADGGEIYLFAGPFKPGETRDAAAGDHVIAIYGARPGDQTGRALTSADFDGDGIQDLVIGSPSADGPSGDRADAGRVDVVFGSPDLWGTNDSIDLALTGDFTVHGATAGDLAGFALAAGNLNGDRAEDIVIGAFYAGGPGDSRPLAGEAYVVYGGSLPGSVADLAITSPDITVYGAAADDRLAEGVAAGDVNGDGLDDIIVPAPFASNLAGIDDSGRTYVLPSPLPTSIDLADHTPQATIYGVDEGDQLGHMTVSGDIDGDGADDILLTAVSADGPENSADLAGEAAIVLSGSLSGDIDTSAGDADTLIHNTVVEARLGRSAGVADVDGDGVQEVLLGAPGTPALNGSARAGAIYLLAGRGLPLELTVASSAQAYTGQEGDAALSTEIYGRMPIAAADLDGIAGDEIIVSASGGDGPGPERAACGYALILFITP
jgi:hypothetical protein